MWISASHPIRELLLWACSATYEKLPRDLRALSRRLLLPYALVHVDFSEQSLWALIIHAGGVSPPRGQLFWNTVLFSHLAPRNDLCENSRKHQSTVCQRYSISTEIQSSHQRVPHKSLLAACISPSVQFMKQQPPSSPGSLSNPRPPLWSCFQVLKWKTD